MLATGSHGLLLLGPLHPAGTSTRRYNHGSDLMGEHRGKLVGDQSSVGDDTDPCVSGAQDLQS
jgi:hypothetical protein